MKKLVRSVFDPSPRNLSVRSLALLVGMLTCGIVISVHEYLESARPGLRAASTSTVEPRACKQDACRVEVAPGTAPEMRSGHAPSPSDDRESSPEPRRAVSSAQGVAPAQWNPEGTSGESRDDPHAGSCSADETGRIGSVSIW